MGPYYQLSVDQILSESSIVNNSVLIGFFSDLFSLISSFQVIICKLWSFPPKADRNRSITIILVVGYVQCRA